MPEYATLIIRCVLAVLGLLAIALATLLYEDEEGAIQSKLEDVWVRLDRQGVTAIDAHAGFLSKIAQITSHLTDKALGVRLISVQALGVSGWFSIAGFGFWFLPAALAGGVGALVIFIVVGLGGACIGSLPIVSARCRNVPFYLIVPLWVTCLVLCAFFLREMEFFLALIAGSMLGLATYSIFLIFARSTLRRMARRSSSFAALFQAIVALPVMVAPWVPIAAYSRSLGPSELTWGWTGFVRISIFLAVIANSALLLLALAFTLVALTFISHRLFWPLPTRIIYAIQRSDLAERKKVLRRAGLALLVLSLAPLREVLSRMMGG